MAEKLIPHTANALTVSLTDKMGDSEYLGVSQKGLNDLVNGDGSGEGSSSMVQDAPSDGKFYARQNGAWVAVNVTAI